MKKRIALLVLVFSFTFSFAQKDAIVGEWYTHDKEAVVTIFLEGEKISGKTTWMKESLDDKGNPKLDKLNPNEELRGRKRLGLKIMQDFIYKGDNIWEDGRIYKPDNGKTYGGTATLIDNNTLSLKGYVIGFSFIGKSSTWTRKID